jgi:hypothetical protein
VSTNSAVSSSSKSTSTTPDSKRRCRGQPAREHGQHRPVVREHLGREPVDPVRARDRREVLEQQRGHALALLAIVDVERGLGVVAVRPPLVARPPDELSTALGHERDPVAVVDDREVVELGVRQRRLGGEVPAVAAVGRLTLVEGSQLVAVGGGDRADERRVAVAEDDGRCPLVQGHHAVSGGRHRTSMPRVPRRRAADRRTPPP